MTAVDGTPPPEPFFLEGPAGPLFALYHPPAAAGGGDSAVVVVPPFAEEMNQSRRMMALQARALARAGVGALIVDLFGTGDSAGDFADARWDIWRRDVGAALGGLAERGHGTLGLLGIRLGGLLAMDVAAGSPARVGRVVLWQPVGRGERMLTQFLRLRVAGTMGDGAGQETTASLREGFAAGRSVEVAGYEIAPDLAAALDAADIAPLGPAAGTAVDWFEMVAGPDRPIPPASRRIIDAWTAAGVPVAATTLPGDAFWSIQETTVVPGLLDATTGAFRRAGR